MDYQIEIDDESIHRRLRHLLKATNDLTPLMREIGPLLEGAAQRAFAEERAPDGGGWARLSEVTIALREKAGRWPGKKLQASGELAQSISWLATTDSVTVGTNVIYAAVQQFGAKKREFKGKAPWGDIPPRPFLGVSDDNRDDIRELVVQYVLATFGRA